MVTKIICSECKKDLEVLDVVSNPLQLITIKIKPCDCKVTKEKELKEQLEEIKKLVNKPTEK